MTSSIKVVLITAPDEDTAAPIARAVVEERLAACVNIVPRIRSIYRWQEKLIDEAEVLLIAKTDVDRVGALVDRVKALHPYSVPEILALPIEIGAADYCDWVVQQTRPVAF